MLQIQGSLGEGQQGNILKRRFFGQAPPFPRFRPKGSPRGTASSSGRCEAAGVGRDAAGAALPSRGGSSLPGTESGNRKAAGRDGAKGLGGARFGFFSSNPPVFLCYLPVGESGEYLGAPRLGCRTVHGLHRQLRPRLQSRRTGASATPRPPQSALGKGVLKNNQRSPRHETLGASRRTGSPGKRLLLPPRPAAAPQLFKTPAPSCRARKRAQHPAAEPRNHPVPAPQYSPAPSGGVRPTHRRY